MPETTITITVKDYDLHDSDNEDLQDVLETALTEWMAVQDDPEECPVVSTKFKVR